MRPSAAVLPETTPPLSPNLRAIHASVESWLWLHALFPFASPSHLTVNPPRPPPCAPHPMERRARPGATRPRALGFSPAASFGAVHVRRLACAALAAGQLVKPARLTKGGQTSSSFCRKSSSVTKQYCIQQAAACRPPHAAAKSGWPHRNARARLPLGRSHPTRTACPLIMRHLDSAVSPPTAARYPLAQSRNTALSLRAPLFILF